MRPIRQSIIRLGYNLAFVVLLALSVPWLILRLARRGHWRPQFRQRFGRFTPEETRVFGRGRVLWLHAVSVGEVGLVVRIANALQERLPRAQLVVSTTTTTGMAELNRRLPPNLARIYYPLDLRAWVRRSLMAVRPRALVLVEAEIWPNFLWRAGDLSIPVLLVNARVSERSRERYRRIGCIFRDLFASMKLVCCASPAEVDRMLDVGCRQETVRVVGNLKYDLTGQPETRPRVEALLQQAGFTPDRQILVGGSTHPGEEALLGRVLLSLKTEFPGLLLVTVPRHFERAADALVDLENLGLKATLRSQLNAASIPSWKADALVVDSTGELRSFYDHATVVVMGKSFLARGGQNPIEPAAAGRAIITGPHMENFGSVMEDFARHDAVIQVPDEAALGTAVARLLRDSALRETIGRRAQAVVQAGAGAVERTAEAIVAEVGLLFL
jgi:3-deoxy-D-manno-octulosonic-acid transferase